jgi:hypothetical protein
MNGWSARVGTAHLLCILLSTKVEDSTAGQKRCEIEGQDREKAMMQPAQEAGSTQYL